MAGSVSIKWSSQFTVTPPTSRYAKSLFGDKVLLPPSALEQLLNAATITTSSNAAPDSRFDPFNPYSFAEEQQSRAQSEYRQQQLPHPLTFRLVNPQNGHIVYAGIREFSADEGTIVLSPFLRHSLGLSGSEDGLDMEDENQKLQSVTIHAAELERGTFVRLRPLEAGYDPEDWKALLERHLSSNFTTLTKGELLEVESGHVSRKGGGTYRFFIDEVIPEHDGVCIVDTDLEVDIEPLNEEQARETLKRQAEKSQGHSQNGALSHGGVLEVNNIRQGLVVEGYYVDYELETWDRNRVLEVEVDGNDSDGLIDLFASPFSSHQRRKPQEEEHVFHVVGSRYPKKLQIRPTNVEIGGAERLYISVHGYPLSEEQDQPQPTSFSYNIQISYVDVDGEAKVVNGTDDESADSDDVRCKNCRQWVPKGTMMLHENFCLRNNILCDKCNEVFQKSSEEWASHWHCTKCDAHGNSDISRAKHDGIEHTPVSCPNCNFQAASILEVAHHRTTTCPGKLILCKFCHLVVPQEGDPDGEPNAEALMSGLTVHELADGSRTTECHICNSIVRLRDMAVHMKHHDFERQRRPTPRVCRNVNCGRTYDHSKAQTTESPDLRLCKNCFGPLYVSLYDPEGKALKRRVERRYLTQLVGGCGKEWCRNEYCKTGRQHIGGLQDVNGTKEALPLIRPIIEQLPGSSADEQSPLQFCTDEASQRRRTLAEMMSHEYKSVDGGYKLEWCVAALEAEGGDLDKSRIWLKDRAPTRGESK